MPGIPEGLEVDRGLAGLVDGLLLWAIASVFATTEQLLGSGSLAWELLALLGFAAMVLFPLWYWVCKPVVRATLASDDERSQHLARVTRAVPVVVAVALVGVFSAGWLPLAVELV